MINLITLSSLDNIFRIIKCVWDMCHFINYALQWIYVYSANEYFIPFNYMQTYGWQYTMAMPQNVAKRDGGEREEV